MDTAQQALFKAMLNGDWFTQSDGDVESPTGYFGYMVNAPADWFEVAQNFCDVISETDSDNMPEWFPGVYSAVINSDGIITIYKHGDYVRTNTAVLGIEPTLPVRAAMKWYKGNVSAFAKWNNEEEN